ncbi:MAG: FHA domain-containing protein [Chloroflexi bacterium]|nr:FHA domain-containing protein [Chloroflexota bacterium]MDL1885843.1 FHA domain-containing protein [Anaerolineae bacterium CFX8]
MKEKRDSDLNEQHLRWAATRGLGDTDFEEGQPRWGTAHFGSRTNLLVYVRGVPEPFIFDANAVEELVIGRFDPDTNTSPHIDLQNFGGAEKGVSRKHAVILRHEGSLNIMDLGSHNGSYLNGQRLIANQPRVLRDGDDLRLGHLVLHINFARV